MNQAGSYVYNSNIYPILVQYGYWYMNQAGSYVYNSNIYPIPEFVVWILENEPARFLCIEFPYSWSLRFFALSSSGVIVIL